MANPSLKLIVLKTDQVESVRDFYARLGFTFVEERHGKGPLHFSASLGDGILEVYPLPVGSGVDTSTRLGFGVVGLAGIVEKLRDGFEVRGPKQTPWGLRAVVTDPDRRIVELYEDPATDTADGNLPN